jgi:hypothetical protein
MLTLKEHIEYFQLQENLSDAMNDLVDRLKHDGYVKGIEHEVAADWDVKPQLLLRMFKQKYNKEPKDMDISTDETKYVEAAKKKAAKYRNQFSGEFDKYVGKVFERPNVPGKKYAFVAWTGKDIHVISIPKQEERRLTFPNTAAGEKFMRKVIIDG